MTEQLNAILATSEGINLVLLIGLAILAGTVGARIIKALHIPQIIGYITIGVILGPILKIIPSAGPEGAEIFNLRALEIFNLFALGVIGFLIGAELERDIFVKFGKQVIAILLFEGGLAFFLVGTTSFLVLNYYYAWQTALALGFVFGAICAATDPASTVNVLWEYKTRGPLTTMLTAVVALDDALALVLYITSVSLAGFLTGTAEAGFFVLLLHAVIELVGSLALGFATGLLLREIVKRVDDDDMILVFSIGTIILTIGLAKHLEFDIILSSMACGVTLINLSPRRSHKSFDAIRKISPPIYVLFFVIIGSRLNVSMTGQISLMAGVYVVCSVIGKTTGAYWGASYSKAVPTVRKYLGFCLYQQGTIAIALLIMASRRFDDEISDMMLSVIIVGVFILQFIGPLFTKVGVRKAGEVGMNITEDDLIKTHSVGDVMDAEAPVISAGMSLSEVIKFVGNTTSFYYSVVDKDRKLMGAVTLDGIRNTFMTQELNDWLVAIDIMEPVIATVTPEMPLAEAFERTKKLDVEHLPVVAAGPDDKLVGVLNCRAVHRSLSAEVLARQQKADGAMM
ncbi:MAG: cation:proton antiporter domain-containing protein [Planctomycetota bacterium]|jgi:Kef-type K+ transport system membrane component KefB